MTKKPLSSEVKELRHNVGELQKKVVHLRKVATLWNKRCAERKAYAQQAELFIAWCLANERCTKEELRLFFKRVKHGG